MLDSMQPKLTIKELTSKINVGIYEDLIISLLQVSPFTLNMPTCSFLSSYFQLFQYCEQLGISRSTTYLSLVYLNIIFKRKDYVALDKLTLLSICCVWIAIKVLFFLFSLMRMIRPRLDWTFITCTGLATGSSQLRTSRVLKLRS